MSVCAHKVMVPGTVLLQITGLLLKTKNILVASLPPRLRESVTQIKKTGLSFVFSTITVLFFCLHFNCSKAGTKNRGD